MTMGSSVSRVSGQHATAAEPVVSSAPVGDQTVPEPVTTTIPGAVVGVAASAATTDLSASPCDKGKKRKADDSASADEKDSLLSSSSPPAAKRVKVEETEQAQPVLESIFGGPPGPHRDVPLVSSKPKRARQDDDEENVRAAKRARTSSPAAVDAPRGLKRRVDDDDDDEGSPKPAKRLRADNTTSAVEEVDEEVPRADLPLSAADVVRAASPSNITEIDAGVAQDPAPAKEKTTFFSLPVEIREMIYELVLVAPKPVVPRVAYRSQSYRIGFPIGRLSSILLVNKQVKEEALHFIIRENVFKLSIKHHRAWLNNIKREFSHCLRRIIVECDGKNKHAAENMIAFQNTLKKRTRGDQLRELTYQIMWTMSGQEAMIVFDKPEFRSGYNKTWKRLQSVTVDWVDRTTGMGFPRPSIQNTTQRLDQEETQRNLSRLALDSGVPVYGRMLRLWRRDKQSLAWCKVTLKDDWEKHCTRDRREGKWMPNSWDKWNDIVNIEIIPPDYS